MAERPKPEICDCCGKPEPAEGWYIVGYDGPDNIDFYCTKECFNGHESHSCWCWAFEDDELEDDYEDQLEDYF